MSSTESKALPKRLKLFGIVVVLVVLGILGEVIIKPARVNFAQTDTSLMKPPRDEIVPNWLLVLLSVLVIPGWPWFDPSPSPSPSPSPPSSSQLIPRFIISISRKHFCWRFALKTLALNLYTCLITMILTDCGKLFFGALRPVWITNCKADTSSLSNPSQTYISQDLCADTNSLDQLRRSFPSGHSSVSMAAASFAVVSPEAPL